MLPFSSVLAITLLLLLSIATPSLIHSIARVVPIGNGVFSVIVQVMYLSVPLIKASIVSAVTVTLGVGTVWLEIIMDFKHQ